MKKSMYPKQLGNEKNLSISTLLGTDDSLLFSVKLVLLLKIERTKPLNVGHGA